MAIIDLEEKKNDEKLGRTWLAQAEKERLISKAKRKAYHKSKKKLYASFGFI